MSIDRLINGIKSHAAAGDARQGVNRWGVVTSVDPTRPAVKVTIQPEGVQSGWLPVAQSGAGASMTAVVIPDVGMNALLVPDLGDGGHYIVVGFAHSDVSVIPVVPAGLPGTLNGSPSTAQTPWQAGEAGFVHKSGSVLRMCSDGTVYVRGPLHVDGPFMANGDVSDRHGSLDRLRGAFNGHTHGDPQGGQTAGPSNPDPE